MHLRIRGDSDTHCRVYNLQLYASLYSWEELDPLLGKYGTNC